MIASTTTFHTLGRVLNRAMYSDPQAPQRPRQDCFPNLSSFVTGLDFKASTSKINPTYLHRLKSRSRGMYVVEGQAFYKEQKREAPGRKWKPKEPLSILLVYV